MTALVSDKKDLRPETLAALTIPELEALLRYHNARYWQDNAPEISDPDYDRLVEALRRKAPESTALQALGPSQFGREVLHPQPMLSLEKAYELKDLAAFIETPSTKVRKVYGELVVSPKIDGVACSLRYADDGKLTVAATRGDGKRGEDITANARRIASIVTQLDEAARVPCEIRGELYMPRSRFQEKYADKFVNARNLTAGAIKQKDPDKSAAYGLAFFAYELLGAEQPTEMDKLAELQRLGFDCPPAQKVGSDDIDKIWALVQETKTISDTMNCDTDGVVLKLDSVAEQRALGFTAHHPNYAIAFKFQAERGESTLLALDWSVARTGRITPVAVVDPVFLSGASVNRASLHNLEIMEKLGLSCGCRVEMSRRGEVIPQVERVISAGTGPGTGPCEIPEKCPSCAGPVERREQFLYCQQPDTCPDALVGTLKHFCKVLDIDGFGDRLLSGLVQGGLVHKPADFFALTREALLSLREDEGEAPVAKSQVQRKVQPQVQIDLLGANKTSLAEIAAEIDAETEPASAKAAKPEKEKKAENERINLRIGEKLADKLVAAVQSRRHLSLEQFLVSLGIDDLGPVMAEKLVVQLQDLNSIRAASVEQLKVIEGFGDERAAHIVEGLQQMSARIDALLQQVEIKAKPKQVDSGHLIAGRSVVFTGKMAQMDRKTAQKKVISLGGKAPANVTKELDYLVIGDLGSPLLGEGKKSGKHDKADKLIAKGAKIRILGEADFWQMIASNKEA